MNKYVVSGNVCGKVSEHKTLSAAYASMRKAHKRAKRMSGCSDVAIRRIDGASMDCDERNEIRALEQAEHFTK